MPLSSALVRSRSTVYDVTSISAARAVASSRVRLVPGMLAILAPEPRLSDIGERSASHLSDRVGGEPQPCNFQMSSATRLVLMSFYGFLLLSGAKVTQSGRHAPRTTGLARGNRAAHEHARGDPAGRRRAWQQRATAPIASETTEQASGSTYLCTGYAGCRNAGYSDAGYGAVNSQMYWRMYSGHNCTNYAAYRMIQAGMSDRATVERHRAWPTTGATRWLASRHSRPAVGAVAWWDRYDGGIGSSGHVAYVERVVSADEIVISEDSLERRLPLALDHPRQRSVADRLHPLRRQGRPEHRGAGHHRHAAGRRRARRSRAAPGRPDRAPTITRQWYADGAPIAGATGRTFTPTAAEKGLPITVATHGDPRRATRRRR